jgi:hypothetical protein
MTKELVQAQFGAHATDYVHSDVHSRGESLDLLLGRLQCDSICSALDIATGAGHTALALSPLAKREVGI